jgi:hypothetical protein
MSEKVYAAVWGPIQFDPRQRDAGGKQVTDVTIKNVSGNKLVSITIWPEFQIPVAGKKGDWIGADGEFTQRPYQAADGSQREGLQVSAGSLVHVPCVPKTQNQVVQAAPVVAADAAVVQSPGIPF